MTPNDLQLLHQFANDKSQDAFAELVQRHVNLVYSAALRQVRSPQLAEEVAQSAFLDLAQNAQRLSSSTILTAWLYQVTRRTAIDVVRRESRRQLREQIAVEMTAMNSHADDWTHIEPLLDEAMGALDDTDRAAILLRYFENKSLREVGQQLGVSDDAAQKRVSRAIERLRETLAKQGVTIGASGLIVILSANAVQAAPAALAVTISVAASGATILASTTTSVAAKAIAMTTLQKSIIATTAIVLAGAGLFEAHQASQLRDKVQTLQQQQAPIAEQLQQLQRAHDDATNQLASLLTENAKLKSGQLANERVRLRGEIGGLKQRLAASEAKSNAPNGGFAKMMKDPAMKEFIHQAQVKLVKERYRAFFDEQKLTPEQTQKMTQLISDAYLKGSEKVTALQEGTMKPAEIAAEEEAAHKELGAKLVELLGQQGAERLKEYNDEVPARATLDLLSDNLGADGLSAEQRASLFQLVKAEPFELTHGISGDFDQAFFGSQADIDAYLKRVVESNQRVLQQASGFLSPAQLSALDKVLTNGVTARITQGAALFQKR